MSHTYDLVVIGAGSGGLAAAKRAAHYGAKVAIIEKSRVGGTCVISGCIPKKIMSYAAHMAAEYPLQQLYGIHTNTHAVPPISFKSLCKRRDEIVAHLEIAHQRHLEAASIALHIGTGHILDAHHVACDHQVLETKHMIISTGSKPNPLDCVGSQWAWNSDDFFLQTTQPKRVAIIGGGYIAIELASILHYLGTQVIMLMRNSLLREFDADIVEECKQSLESAGVTIHQNCSIQAIQPETTDHHKHYTLLAHNPLNPNLSFANLDAVIVAIGRVPHLPESNIALAVDTHGGLKVNEHHQTNISSIYAIGDVIQRQNLTPVAIRAGRTVAEYLFNNNPTVMRYENIATAVFSLPPIACVGLSEQAAKQRYGQENILVYKNRYYPLKYANTPKLLSFSTCQKMIVERKSLKVLGLHMTGIDAPEIMQGFACCLQAGLTKPQLDATFPIHPTQAEEWVLMR